MAIAKSVVDWDRKNVPPQWLVIQDDASQRQQFTLAAERILVCPLVVHLEFIPAPAADPVRLTAGSDFIAILHQGEAGLPSPIYLQLGPPQPGAPYQPTGFTDEWYKYERV
jgi:hypothetical protein